MKPSKISNYLHLKLSPQPFKVSLVFIKYPTKYSPTNKCIHFPSKLGLINLCEEVGKLALSEN